MKFVVRLSLLLTLAFSLVACSTGDSANGSTASSQLIAPGAYVSQFTDTNATHILIDVRTPQEFAEGHIAGSVNIPVDQIASRLNEIPSDIPVVVYCRSGNRSATAAQTLVANNYSEVYDLGGIISWTGAGYPVE